MCLQCVSYVSGKMCWQYRCRAKVDIKCSFAMRPKSSAISMWHTLSLNVLFTLSSVFFFQSFSRTAFSQATIEIETFENFWDAKLKCYNDCCLLGKCVTFSWLFSVPFFLNVCEKWPLQRYPAEQSVCQMFTRKSN